MSVQELGSLHQRYIDLSERFRAAWTFHQFLQGLAKVVLDGSAPGTGVPGLPAEFQQLYATLKEISQSLNESETGRVRQELAGAEQHLEAITIGLLREDSKVSPSLLRQFFQRVRNYDERILTQLVKFYLYSRRRGGEWSADGIDKADFLLTKLGEASPGALRDQARLREVLDGLWAIVADAPNDGASGQSRRREIEAIREEISQVDDVDQLADRATVLRYRELKHSLGGAFFEPETLLTVLETNRALKSKIRQLYGHEESRIAAESQRIAELERGARLDPALDADLTAFRRAMERVERGLQQDDLRLEAVTGLKRHLQALLPRLAAAGGGEDALSSQADAEAAAPVALEPENDDQVGENFARIVEALEDTNPADDPKAVSLSRDILALRLDPREVTAYRRLAGQLEASARKLERFVLEGAAVRLRANEEAEEIMGILDESGATRQGPVFDRARETTRLADLYVRRFAHFIDQAVQDGRFPDAQALQVLRMRLVRDYSGLWLLVNR